MTAGAIGLVDAYEQLRAVALGAQPIRGPGLANLRRQGMVAWIGTASTTPDPTPWLSRRLPLPAPIAASELTLILASLVATLSAEPSHA